MSEPDGSASPTDSCVSPDVRPAHRRVRSRENRRIDVGLILGSGLDVLIEMAVDTRVFEGSDLEGYPVATAAGHAGDLVIGRVGDRTAGFVRGRVHSYEGYSLRELGFPVRLLRALGARRLLVTGAAGGIRADLEPGTFVLLEDHLAVSFPGGGSAPAAHPSTDRSLEARPARRGGPPYDPDWRCRARSVIRAAELPVSSGTYGWMRGPSYETPAEIRMLRRVGADVVGMSTVPEVLEARRLGMRILGVSTVTNRAAGLGFGVLAHREVIDVGARRAGDLAEVISDVLSDRGE